MPFFYASAISKNLKTISSVGTDPSGNITSNYLIPFLVNFFSSYSFSFNRITASIFNFLNIFTYYSGVNDYQ